MRRKIDSLYTAMPYVVFTYTLAVLTIFTLGLLFSGLPLFSMENLSQALEKDLAPHGKAFQLLIILWIVTGVSEKLAIRKWRKTLLEAERKKESLGKFYLVTKDGSLIPKSRKSGKRRPLRPIHRDN